VNALLRNRQESFRKICSERGELGLAGGGAFEFLLFPDVIIVAVESDSRAEISVDQVGGLGEDLKCIGGDGSEKGGAVPSSNADVIWIDGESD
jgi:hypothetical protein